MVYQMQVWCIKCRYGVSNAGMVYQMQVCCIKCRYGVSNAGMVYQMQVWCIKCRYGVSNAGMVYQMQVWCINYGTFSHSYLTVLKPSGLGEECAASKSLFYHSPQHVPQNFRSGKYLANYFLFTLEM